jgi:L-amino acid N-acyltransferase YncA
MKSLWARYMEELRDTRFIEKEWGFISYSFITDVSGEAVIYLEDVYVIAEKRREGLALSLVEEAEALGFAAGVRSSLAVIRLENKGHAESLKAHLAVGFVPSLAEGDRIWLKREIKPKETL